MCFSVCLVQLVWSVKSVLVFGVLGVVAAQWRKIAARNANPNPPYKYKYISEANTNEFVEYNPLRHMIFVPL